LNIIKFLEEVTYISILLFLISSSAFLIVFEIYLISYGIIQYFPFLKLDISTILTFFGAIIGGGLTLLGVLLTLSYYKKSSVIESYSKKHFLYTNINSSMVKISSDIKASINNKGKVLQIINDFKQDHRK
jgi:hypothetical protein